MIRTSSTCSRPPARPRPSPQTSQVSAVPRQRLAPERDPVKVLEIIGEAASGRITTDTRRAYPQIPWRQIIGLRNRVVHGYFDVDLKLIWQIVRQDIPILIDQLQDLLPPDTD